MNGLSRSNCITHPAGGIEVAAEKEEGIHVDADGRPHVVTGFTYGLTMDRQPKVWAIGESGWEQVASTSIEGPAPVRADQRRRAAARLGLEHLQEGREGGIHPLRSGRVKFKPYQFRPLLKFKENPHDRILVADEAGLGKTIEAAYILLEEMAHAPMSRVLVLCPSHLRTKWQRELRYRFGLEFRSGRGLDLLEALESHDRGFHLIASIDSMRNRQDQLRSAVSTIDEDIDLLIIDEIHHLIGRSGLTLRRELGMLLSMVSKRVVGLTATPVQLEREDLLRVLEVIDPGAFESPGDADILTLHERFVEAWQQIRSGAGGTESLDEAAFPREVRSAFAEAGMDDQTGDEAALDFGGLDEDCRAELAREVLSRSPLESWMTRSRRKDVGEARDRAIESIRIDLSTEGLEVVRDGERLKLTEERVFRQMDELFKEAFAYNHRRQLSSSWKATSKLLQLGAEGYRSWDVPSDWDGAPPDEELNQEVRGCARKLWERARTLGTDTKWDRLVQEIRSLKDDESSSKAVVFTQWRPTLAYMRRRAPDIEGVPTYFVGGEDSEWRRQATVEEFSQIDGFAVLFSSDVLAEGLDLIAANAVVNYDLPLNPQRIEQRIGRVDRIGQPCDRVHVVNLLVRGGVDEEIHDKLLERIDAFRSTVGDASPILREEQGDATVDNQAIEEVLHNEEERRRIEEEVLIMEDAHLDASVQEVSETGNYLRPALVRDIVLTGLELLGEEALHVRPVGDASVEIEARAQGLAHVLAALCADEESGYLVPEINASLERGRWTFSPEEDGHYLPPQHPVVQALASAVDRSIAKEPGPAMLDAVIEGGDPGVVVLEVLRFEGPDRKTSRWSVARWWSETGEVERMDDGSLLDLVMSAASNEVSEAEQQDTPAEVERALDAFAQGWFEERMTAARNRMAFDLDHRERRLRRLSESLSGMEEHDAGSIQQELAEIKRLRDRLDTDGLWKTDRERMLTMRIRNRATDEGGK